MRSTLAILALAGALVSAWLFLRLGDSSYTDATQIDRAIGQGRPVLVEFYSDY